jgi:hypothetical protein
MEKLTPEVLVTKYQDANPLIDETTLNGIHTIDWQHLHHAHGRASDVPALLRAALARDEYERYFAFQLLHETIWHQGTIYDVTAYVVPFLQQMLLSPQTPDKALVAFLITSLAEGESKNSLWVSKTREAIGKNLPLLYPFLEHTDETIRWSVAHTLGYYPQFAEETLPLLEKALFLEKDPLPKEEILKTIKILQEQ